MTKDEQKQFVNDIMTDLTASLNKMVEKVPENWDGIELRQYISDYYQQNYIISGKLKDRRKRDYQNSLIVENLL